MEEVALKLALQYGPWALIALVLPAWLKSRAAKTKLVAEHATEVESLKSEYQKQRDDAERRFTEFKAMYHQHRQELLDMNKTVVGQYDRNVELVKAYQRMAEDQMNIMTLTSLRWRP